MRSKIKRKANEEQVNRVREALREYNATHFEAFDRETIVLESESDTGELIGGLVIELYGDWLKLEYLWISDDHRGKGIGSQLLDQAMELGYREGKKYAFTSTFSFQALPFYQKYGFEVVWAQEDYPVTSTRYFLRRPIQGWKPGQKRWIPATLRTLEKKDVEAVAQVSIDVWRTSYAGVLPEAYLKNLNVESRKRIAEDVLEDQTGNSYMVVAEAENGEIAGFARGNIVRDGKKYLGELGAIYILEDYHRGGIGTRLMAQVAKFFQAQNIEEMVVWVLEASPSCAFYEAIGGKMGSEKVLTVFGKQLREVSYHWSDVRSLAGLLEM